MNTPSGKAIIFSAPSGSGKTSLVKHLMQQVPNLGFSISACTRDKRGRHEVHGRDYYFLSIDEFKNKIDQDQFVEWEEVYAGNFYGTLKEEVHRIWKEGKAVIFDVDVKGGTSLKKYFGEKYSTFMPLVLITILIQSFLETFSKLFRIKCIGLLTAIPQLR